MRELGRLKSTDEWIGDEKVVAEKIALLFLQVGYFDNRKKMKLQCKGKLRLRKSNFRYRMKVDWRLKINVRRSVLSLLHYWQINGVWNLDLFFISVYIWKSFYFDIKWKSFKIMSKIEHYILLNPLFLCQAKIISRDNSHCNSCLKLLN